MDYRTLHNWQKRGILSPSNATASGSGSVSRFDCGDALHILLLAELRSFGFEVRVLERVAPRLRELVDEADGNELVVASESGVILLPLEELGDHLSTSEPAVVFGISKAATALGALTQAA